ncbi:MAG: nucleoside deaminase [Elusimicrobia bacterium]|jgi:tRNA(adenine34) deaminase|nr:nucleoside deaminase [Elusimicrobiota bacterium]
MEKAISVARAGGDNKEIPVGAVVVGNNKIIGEGYNSQKAENDPSAHAEVVALRKAAQFKSNFRLDGCDLYVTVKPCKMCREAIKRARIEKVFFASPKAREATHTTQYLRLKEYSDESVELIRSFFKKRR